jgi:hypothetical protein
LEERIEQEKKAADALLEEQKQVWPASLTIALIKEILVFYLKEYFSCLGILPLKSEFVWTKASFPLIAKANSQARSECFQIL